MYARIHQLTAEPGRIEATADHFRSAISAAYTSEPAFRGALLLANRETGEMLSITLFSTAEGLDATALDAEMEAVRGSLMAGSREVPEGQRFEVIAQVR